jgi:hypothetical protein
VSSSLSHALESSWPLWEQPAHFDLGHILNSAITDVLEPDRIGGLGIHHAGLWECDLASNTLIWSGGIYDIFGFPRTAAVTRDMAVACYAEHSRAAMERMRAHAIRHRCGFTLDVEISASAVGEARTVRLIAAPVCEGDLAVRLHGLKLLLDTGANRAAAR